MGPPFWRHAVRHIDKERGACDKNCHSDRKYLSEHLGLTSVYQVFSFLSAFSSGHRKNRPKSAISSAAERQGGVKHKFKGSQKSGVNPEDFWKFFGKRLWQRFCTPLTCIAMNSASSV
jgi:hypothetical protein